MAPDLEELHEHAEQGASDARFAPVTVSMAVLAVFVAVVSMMGGRVHADEMLAQTRATDQWAQYQAKVIRERSYEVFLDQLSVFSVQSRTQADQIKQKYSKEIARYISESKDIQTQAYATENDVKILEKKSNWYDVAEVLLDAGLVICSITMLTQKKLYWYLGLASGITGVAIGVAGLFIR
jgi:hypothetical protein